MPAPRLLPPTQELQTLVEQGLTHAQITEWIKDRYNVVVARSAVSAALSRAGLTRTGMRYRDEIPWRVKAEHLTQYPARMLRLLGRRRLGMDLIEDEIQRLDAWLTSLEERELVVAYCPDGPGFIYVDADEIGDGEQGIPIRKRTIQTDELHE